jgi:hypothetical protein
MNVLRTGVRIVGALALIFAWTGVALGADAVSTVDVSGTVAGPDGGPIEVTEATLWEQETPDSESIKSDFDVADDGTFTVSLREWGTADQPALALIRIRGPETEETDVHGCIVIRWPIGAVEVEIPGEVPTDPLTVVLDEMESIGACTATPEPDPGALVTLPPTDTRGPLAGGVRPAVPGTADILLVVAILVLACCSIVVARRPIR